MLLDHRRKSVGKESNSVRADNLSGHLTEQSVHPRVSGAVDQVGVLVVFAVVVQRLQVVDDDGIAEQLREHVAPNELRRDLLEDVFLVFVDFVGLASGAGALVGGVRQRTRRRRAEYFLVELLEIVDV